MSLSPLWIRVGLEAPDESESDAEVEVLDLLDRCDMLSSITFYKLLVLDGNEECKDRIFPSSC